MPHDDTRLAAVAGAPSAAAAAEADLRLIDWLRRELSLGDLLPLGIDGTLPLDRTAQRDRPKS